MKFSKQIRSNGLVAHPSFNIIIGTRSLDRMITAHVFHAVELALLAYDEK